MTRAEALRRLPGKDRTKVVLVAVRRILTGFGFPSARVSVSSAGQIVAVGLPTSQACRAHRDEEARVAHALKQIVPYARTVTVTVGASRVPVSQYVAAHCAAPKLPGGSGRVVLTKSGTGLYETAPFTIRTASWSVDWTALGTYFQVFVFRGSSGYDHAEPNPITASPPGSGTQRYKGPGTFRLRISGMDEWQVRVREG